MPALEEKRLFPTPAHAQLDIFAGKWNTSGIMQTGQGEPVTITGTDTYEWLPGGYFLLHKVKVMMGKEHKESLEIIGYDPDLNVYTMHAFDDQGVVTIMHARHRQGIWTFQGDTLRFTGGFGYEHKILSGEWKHLIAGEWKHLMNITLTRQNP